jgi:membrane-associated HD superfamily phosphohydrolase
MVSSFSRGTSRCVNAWLLSGLVALVAAFSAHAAPVPEYSVGDVVKDDIVTPVQLVVPNSDETETQRLAAASKVAVICRYYTNAIDQAESELHSAFANTRRTFLERLDETFQRRQLDEAAVSTPSFSQFYSSFQHQNEFMPITTNLARVWAKGESDRAIEESLLATLHEAMLHFIRPPNIAPEVKFGNNVRMVPLGSWDEPLTLEKSDRRGFLVSKNDVVTFTRLRENLQQSAPAEERATLNYLINLIKTNCVPDVEITIQARVRRAEATVSGSERYEPGQIVARRGQVIDRRLKAALDQLREQAPAVTPPAPVPEKAQTTPAKSESQQTQQSLAQPSQQVPQSQQSRQWTQ